MPNNKDDLQVDLIKPSSKERHTVGEWTEHIVIRESTEVRRDIVQARERMGQFTVRFVAEALYGDECAAQIFGDDGGQELVRDVVITRETLGALAGNVGGPKARAVAQRENLLEEPRLQIKTEVVSANRGRGEGPKPESSKEDAQIELLRNLLKMMDPDTIKKALMEK